MILGILTQHFQTNPYDYVIVTIIRPSILSCRLAITFLLRSAAGAVATGGKKTIRATGKAAIST